MGCGRGRSSYYHRYCLHRQTMMIEQYLLIIRKKLNSDLLNKAVSGYGCRGENRDQTKSVV